MSRLIDVDNLINNLRLLLNRTSLCEISPHESISVGEIATLIKNEPTAYDVDKVVSDIDNNVPGITNMQIMMIQDIVKSDGID